MCMSAIINTNNKFTAINAKYQLQSIIEQERSIAIVSHPACW
jgi:hypothetical protein